MASLVLPICWNFMRQERGMDGIFLDFEKAFDIVPHKRLAKT